MERLGAACSGKLLLTWGLYASVVASLSSLLATLRLPDAVGWAAGLVLGFAVLLWTREI